MRSRSGNLRTVVEDMLLDAGYEQSEELRAVLLSLGSLAGTPAPAPGVRLAALLAAPLEGKASPKDELAATQDELAATQDELVRRRGLRRHRSTIVGLAVVAGMGLGATGVAASVSDGEFSGFSVRHMLEDWVPAWIMPATGIPKDVPPAPPVEQQSGSVSVPQSGQSQFRWDDAPARDGRIQGAVRDGGSAHKNAANGAAEAKAVQPGEGPVDAVQAGSNGSGIDGERGQIGAVPVHELLGAGADAEDVVPAVPFPTGQGFAGKAAAGSEKAPHAAQPKR